MPGPTRSSGPSIRTRLTRAIELPQPDGDDWQQAYSRHFPRLGERSRREYDPRTCSATPRSLRRARRPDWPASWMRPTFPGSVDSQAWRRVLPGPRGGTHMPTTVVDLRPFKADGHRSPCSPATNSQTGAGLRRGRHPADLHRGHARHHDVLGFDTTIPVTIDAMVRHCQSGGGAVCTEGPGHRGIFPFGSYEVSTGTGCGQRHPAGEGRWRLGGETGGPTTTRWWAAPLTGAGIPAMGHLGLTPAVGARHRGVPRAGPHRRRRGTTG